jgi:UDP-glucose 4-epimerase
MTILVTGAGGRIGFELTRQLARAGHDVRAWVMPDDQRLDDLRSLGVAIFEGHLADADSLREPIRGVDAVCHLAAALTTHGADDETFVQANVVGTFNVLSTIVEHAPGLDRFVYASSDAVYWSELQTPPLYLPIDEAHPLASGSVYGATKVAAEAMCRAYWQSYGVPFSIVRPTATAMPSELVDPTSPFGRRWFIGGAVAWLRSRQTPSPGDVALLDKLEHYDDGTERLFYLVDESGVASMSMLTHPSDVALGIRALVHHPEAIGEAFNIGASAPFSERTFVEHLAARLDLEAVAITHKDLRPSWHVSSAKARAVLGYQPNISAHDMVDEAT